MKKGVKILLIILGVFVALIAAVVIVVMVTTGAEKQKATDFVKAISTGETSTAYAQFSPALKDVQTQAVFESSIAALKLNDSCKLDVTSLSSETSTATGTQKVVKGTIKCDSKTFNTAEFTYNGESLLYGYSIKP